MKKKFKFRKKLIELANRLGLSDDTVLTVQKKPHSDVGYNELVNNQRRFVKGLLKLPLRRQELRIEALEKAMLRAEQEQLEKQKAAEATSNDSDGSRNS